MSKGLFFGLPSVSVHNTLTPVIRALAASGHDLVYYNSAEFRSSEGMPYRFIPYPARFDGYYAGRIDKDTSYFQFGGILLGAADGLLDFLLEEARRERPDHILHSHLAVWGKLLARRLGLPAITLYSTFVLDQRIMLPFFRRINAGKPNGTGKVHEAVGFQRKYQSLYARLGIEGKPDLWDVYINKGQLNISFILETFQPLRALFGDSFRFVGYPLACERPSADPTPSGRELIYVAMGTITNKDIPLYRTCLDVLRECPLPAIVSLGPGIDPAEFGRIPGRIRVVPFADQQEVLEKAAVFITRGGMASVHEAIGARTPMIVIPLIPEQQVTAERIRELGIGLHLSGDTLTRDKLRAALEQILSAREGFAGRIAALSESMPSIPPQLMACRLINDFLDRERTVIGRFLRQAGETPDAIAVRCGDETLTYAALERHITALATCLRTKGIGKGDLVPVVLGPGMDILISMIGIMRAGAAYVPVDPANPYERINYILSDTACKWVIDADALRDIPVSGDPEISPIPLPAPDELAYVIYTSGSTGKPKGVMVEHAQIHTYITDVIGALDLSPCKSYAILGTFSADAGLTAIFAALCTGATLHIIDVKRYTDLTSLSKQFEANPVDCYKITPSLLDLFLGNDGSADLLPQKKLILGGEPCPAGLAKRVRALLPPGCDLINHYGPTETTVGVLTYTFPSKEEDFPPVVPLGGPLPSVTPYILDAEGEPVPEGTMGELYIAGPLVARGYLHQADLTAQRFVTLGSQRVYRTGDLVKCHPDGHIIFLGRNDDQVKIRGHRIELKEVEHALLSYSPVRQCLVLVKRDARDTIYLAGYIVPAEGFDQEGLLKTARSLLPEYMIPSKWVLLDKWPLTVNNKIDRQALPAPGDDPRGSGSEEGTAGILRHLWCRLLGTEHIDPDDDFFALGGDSMKLMQLNYDLSRQFSLEGLPADLMTPLTISRLARFIDGAFINGAFINSRTEGPALKGPEPEGFDPELASPTQRDLFLQKKLHPDETFPNSSITMKIAGSLDPDRLTTAFARIIRANESLRTGYYLTKGKVCQRIAEDVPFAPEWIPCASDDIDAEIRRITRPFDFGCPPLLRAFILLLPAGDQYLHLDMPHINSDGESLKIMMDELESAYNSDREETGKPQFADFQRRVYAYSHSAAYSADESFWSKQLSGDIPALSFGALQAEREALPSGREALQAERQALHASRGAACVVTPFPSGLLANMNRYLRGRSLTRSQLLLAGYLQVLYQTSAINDLCVLIPVHNRFEKSMDRIVGLLSNVVPVRMNRISDTPAGIWMETLKAAVLGAFRHQRYPFEDIRRIWRGHGYAGDHLAQVFFGYHQNRKTYTFGEVRLDLYIPVRYKENLILSAAVFETPGDLTLRISSRPGGFGEAGLRNLAELYFDTLHRSFQTLTHKIYE